MNMRKMTNSYSLIRYILFSLVSLLLAEKAYADGACSFTNPTGIVATDSSINVYNNSYTRQVNAGMSCTGLFVGVLTSNNVFSTIGSTTNNFQLVNTNGSGDAIPYAVYADSGYATQMTAGKQINYASLSLLTVILGTGSGTFPIYIKTSPGANISAGTYTDTVNISWQYNLCAVGIVACLLPLNGNGNSAVTLNLIVNKACVINSAPNVNLGSQSFVGQFNPVTQTINIQCTKTEGFQSYFTTGANYSAPWNQMKSLLGNYLQYNIYVPNTSTIWNSSNMQSGVGTGFSSNISYQIKLNPAQAEQPAGTYTDTLSFTIQY